MTHILSNLALREDRVARRRNRADLLAQNTGCPIFILPSLSVDEPKFLHATTTDSLRWVIGGSDSHLDLLNYEVAKLFFQSGGSEATFYLLPVVETSSWDESLMAAIDGRNEGFFRRSGVFSLLDHETAGDVVLAPTLSLLMSGQGLAFCASKMLEMAEQSNRYFVILDGPQGASLEEVIAYRKKFNSGKGALYHGRLFVKGFSRALPLSPFAAATYQRSDRERTIEYTPANLSVALPTYEATDPSEEELSQLLGEGVNVLRFWHEAEAKIWGGRTLSKTESYLDYIGCSRFMMALQNSLEDLLAPFVWNVATERQRQIAEATISDFFEKYYDPNRPTQAVDLGRRPEYELTIREIENQGKAFHLDLSVYLNIPMMWVDVQMNFEG